MRTNTKIAVPMAKTHEGAPSPIDTPTKQLRRAIMACMLFEKQFYESGADSATRIAALVKAVPFADAAQAAIDAREKFKLRHAPLLVVREMLRIHKGRQMGDLIARVIQRPDELGELLSLYWKDKPDAPLTSQLKVGLARALKKFNVYQLAKYNRDAAVKLRDVLFLSHARPRDEAQKALFDQLTNNTLPTPDTWEVALSAGANKAETFVRLMAEKKLGAMALLRNLRNMIESGVPEDAIRAALATMDAERVLPFRFISAAKYAPRLEDALEAAMFKCVAAVPMMGGKTALLVDHSHSMDAAVSEKSEITRFEAAGALAMILREISERCRVFTFSDRCVEIPPRSGFAMVEAIRAVRNPTSTLLGAAVRHVYSVFPECERIIVVTDEQSADRPPHPRGHGYIVNVGGNKQGIAYGPWVSIDGWSEAVLSYIQANEAEA
jgi:60 kDa SS-A/Ro ribonucleoprotein